MLRQLTLACLICSISLAIDAAGSNRIYKWVDENGEVHYSQRLPPGQSGEQMREAPPPADDPDAIRSNLQQQVEAANEEQEKQQESAADAKQWQEIQKVRRENCKTARGNLSKLNQGGNKRIRTPDGEVRHLTEEERQKRIAEANKQIKENCSP